MLGGGDCVESGIEGLKVTVLSEAVFAGIEGTLCFGLQHNFGLAAYWLLVQEAILVRGF